MNSQYDIAIIGGGVIGVCSAYYLSQKGLKVLLIEKGEIASGCSYGNGGLIVPSHAVPLASPGALGAGLRWLLDAESPFYIKPRFDVDLFNWLIRFALASRHEQMMRSLPAMQVDRRSNISRRLHENPSQKETDFCIKSNIEYVKVVTYKYENSSCLMPETCISRLIEQSCRQHSLFIGREALSQREGYVFQTGNDRNH